ncbi:ADP-ribosylhydrolase ARH3 isoform X2 [Aethina tumida]|nr:ADP-ribosylhydrolase ARH3 isoform X2 [Aethina tumida]
MTIDKSIMKSKFRGAMLGSLMGDCLGAPFEFDNVTLGDRLVIQKYFDKLEDPTLKVPYKKYTDDTAMLKSVAQFLTDKPEPDYKFLAKLFVREFFKEPNRGYGQGVVEVFSKLKDTKCEDPFKPAKEQFDGSGSYGNGGAMRIAPIPLFFYDDYDAMLDVATKATQITHTNPLGVNGALLQSIAIHKALMCDPKKPINSKDFCNDLFHKIKQIESDQADELDIEYGSTYQLKMKIVENFLNKKYDEELDDEVLMCLGNSVTAHESVPTAIYCFLRALEDIPPIKTDNIFRRTIQYAITLGGDTDTIACMAGSIAGAYLGEETINKTLLKHCEGYEVILEMADNLFECRQAVESTSSESS